MDLKRSRRLPFKQRVLGQLFYVFLLQYLISKVNGQILTKDINTFNNTEFFKIWDSTAGGNSYVGRFVNMAGDINGDGFGDVLIGAEGYDKGTAYLIYGKNSSISDIDVSSSLTPLNGFKISDSTSLAGTALGHAVSYAGDFNGDQIDDFLVGGHLFNNGKGGAFLIYGKKDAFSNIDVSSLDSTQGLKIFDSTTTTRDFLGVATDYIGDYNGDGISDIIIGAHGQNVGRGAFYVIYGTNSKPSHIDVGLPSFSPSQGFKIWDSTASENDRLGVGMSLAGDVNGDGIDDLVIGAYGQNNNTGAAYVIYGDKNRLSDVDLGLSSFSPSQGFKVWNSIGSTEDLLGFGVSDAGDVNGDGIDDFMVGCSGYNLSHGAVYVIFGSRNQTSDIDLGSPNFSPRQGFKIWDSTANNTRSFGYSMKRGDVNGDNVNDFIIGAHIQNTNLGAVYVIYGTPNQSSDIDIGSSSFSSYHGFMLMNSTVDANYFGYAIGCLDVNGDKVDDIIVSSWGQNNKTGAAYVIFGTQKICPENCLTCTLEFLCQSCAQGYVLKDSLCIIPPPVQAIEIVTQTATTSLGVTSTIASIIYIGNSISLRSGLINKMIQNTRYLNLFYSDELITMFHTFKTSFIDPPELSALQNKLTYKDLPFAFASYDIPPSFLSNYWGSLIMILIGGFIFLSIRFLEWYVEKLRVKKPPNEILKYLRLAAFNFLLINLYQSLDEVLFYTILDMRSSRFNSGIPIFSFMLATFFTLLGCFLLYFYLDFLCKYQRLRRKATNHSQHIKIFENWTKKNEHFKVLFNDFKDTNWTLQAFFGFFIIRNTIAGLIYTALFEHSLTQTILLVLLTTVILIGLALKKPFKETSQFIFQIYCEIVVFIVNIIDLIIAIMDHVESDDFLSRERLSKGVIVLNTILSFSCLAFMIVEIFQMVHEKFKTWRSKRRITKIHAKRQVLENSDLSQDLSLKLELNFSTKNQRSFIIDNLETQKSQNSLVNDIPQVQTDITMTSTKQVFPESSELYPPIPSLIQPRAHLNSMRNENRGLSHHQLTSELKENVLNLPEQLNLSSFSTRLNLGPQSQSIHKATRAEQSLSPNRPIWLRLPKAQRRGNIKNVVNDVQQEESSGHSKQTF